MGEARDLELERGPGLGPQPGKGTSRNGKPPWSAASSSGARAEREQRRGRLGGGMDDAPLALDIAAAASTAATSPSLPLRPGGEGDGEVEGEGEGLEIVTDRGVAVGNQARPHLLSSSSALPPPFATLSLVCCSQSVSKRPESEAV